MAIEPLPPKSPIERLLTLRKPIGTYVERFYPLAIGLTAFSLVMRHIVDDAAYKAIVKDVFPTAISLAGVLAAFQGAGQAILLGILNSETIRFLKETGNYKLLVAYLWNAIVLLLVAAGFALAVMIMFIVGQPTWLNNTFNLAITAALSAWAAGAVLRLNRLMYRILLIENGPKTRATVCKA